MTHKSFVCLWLRISTAKDFTAPLSLMLLRNVYTSLVLWLQFDVTGSLLRLPEICVHAFLSVPVFICTRPRIGEPCRICSTVIYTSLNNAAYLLQTLCICLHLHLPFFNKHNTDIPSPLSLKSIISLIPFILQATEFKSLGFVFTYG